VWLPKIIGIDCQEAINKSSWAFRKEPWVGRLAARWQNVMKGFLAARQ
jgi:hypothetical protein